MKEDYHRHGSVILSPPFWAICNYRFGNWAQEIRLSAGRWVAGKIYGINHFLLLILGGIELNREARIGKDLHLIHTGNIHVHPDAVIGDRCGIMHDVTIGTNDVPGAKLQPNTKTGVPVIGNDVFIGAGAKLLGGITIGDDVVIAANSLVTTNIPSGSIAIGVPARAIKKR